MAFDCHSKNYGQEIRFSAMRWSLCWMFFVAPIRCLVHHDIDLVILLLAEMSKTSFHSNEYRILLADNGSGSHLSANTNTTRCTRYSGHSVYLRMYFCILSYVDLCEGPLIAPSRMCNGTPRYTTSIKGCNKEWQLFSWLELDKVLGAWDARRRWSGSLQWSEFGMSQSSFCCQAVSPQMDV